MWGCLQGFPRREEASPRPVPADSLHGDPELHGVLGLGGARPHQLNEEVGAKDAELRVAQLVQGVPVRGRRMSTVCPEHPTGPHLPPRSTGAGSKGGRQLSAGHCPLRPPFTHTQGLLTSEANLQKAPASDSRNKEAQRTRPPSPQTGRGGPHAAGSCAGVRWDGGSSRAQAQPGSGEGPFQASWGGGRQLLQDKSEDAGFRVQSVLSSLPCLLHPEIPQGGQRWL